MVSLQTEDTLANTQGAINILALCINCYPHFDCKQAQDG